MQFITVLAGAQFRPAEAKTALRNATKGQTLTLQRDPLNAHDDNAIEVHLEDGDGTDHFIGFVAKADNEQLAAMLDQDADQIGTLWAEGHEPEVTRCEILDFVNGDTKPTIVIEVSDGWDLGTIVRSADEDGDGEEEYLSGDEDEDDEE